MLFLFCLFPTINDECDYLRGPPVTEELCFVIIDEEGLVKEPFNLILWGYRSPLSLDELNLLSMLFLLAIDDLLSSSDDISPNSWGMSYASGLSWYPLISSMRKSLSILPYLKSIIGWSNMSLVLQSNSSAFSRWCFSSDHSISFSKESPSR